MTGKTCGDVLSLVENYLNVLPIAMSSAEQKQSLVKDCNEQLQEHGLTDSMKVTIS